MTIAFVLSAFSFVTGLYYNLENMGAGFLGAKDKLLAIKYAIPYFLVYFIIFVEQFSQFHADYCMLFYLGLGVF